MNDIAHRQESFTPNIEAVKKETVPLIVERYIEELLAKKRELEIWRKDGFAVYHEQVAEFLSSLPEAQLSSLFKDTFTKIRKETTFFNEFEEAGIYDYVLSGFNKTYLPNQLSDVSWGQEFIDDRAGELFSGPGFREAIIGSESPSRANMISLLAAKGDLPTSLRTLNHEATHGYQFPGFLRRIAALYDSRFSVMDVLRSLHGSTELQEAHAFRFGDGPVQYARSKIADIIENSPLYKGDKDKTAYAVGTVEQLKALHVDTQEVGTLVRMHGKWDAKNKRYPTLEAVVAETAREYFRYSDVPGYQPKDYDYVADLENLIRVHHLQVEISHKQAQLIVQNELLKVLPPRLSLDIFMCKIIQ